MLFSQGEVAKAKGTSPNIHCRATVSVRGVLTMQVAYRSHAMYVSGNWPTLLGLDWLQTIWLDWHSLGVAYLGENGQTVRRC